MFLHRAYYYNKEDTDPSEAEVIVAKQPQRPLDTITLTWLENYTLFENRYESTGA